MRKPLDEFNCNECGIPMESMQDWIQILVKTGHQFIAGFICSVDCLVDYTANTMRLKIGDTE